jgi:hypothetical protein
MIKFEDKLAQKWGFKLIFPTTQPGISWYEIPPEAKKKVDAAVKALASKIKARNDLQAEATLVE